MNHDTSMDPGKKLKAKRARPSRSHSAGTSSFASDESTAALVAALAAAAAGLHRLRPHSAKDLVWNLYPKIQALQDLGWRYGDIAALFQSSGVAVSERTLREYASRFKTQADAALAKAAAAEYWKTLRSSNLAEGFASDLDGKLKTVASRRRAAAAATTEQEPAGLQTVAAERSAQETRPTPPVKTAAPKNSDGASDSVSPRRSASSSSAPFGAGTPRPVGGSLRSPPSVLPAKPEKTAGETPWAKPAPATSPVPSATGASGAAVGTIPEDLAPGIFFVDPGDDDVRSRPFVWLVSEIAKNPNRTFFHIPDGRAGKTTLPVRVPKPRAVLSGKVADWEALYASYE